MKKTFFLVMTLAIPVAIFLFLKFFGRNEFDVPVFFADGVEGCTSLPEDLRAKSGLKKSLKSQYIYALLEPGTDENNHAFVTELVRIQDAFYDKGEPYFVLLMDSAFAERSNELVDFYTSNGLNQNLAAIQLLVSAELQQVLQCGLGLGVPGGGHVADMVLIDTEGRIRGYYPRDDKEQTDRLILELKILKSSR